MQLTGKEIISNGIITNYIEKGVQQQGVDVRLEKVFKLDGVGHVATDKTHIPDRIPVELTHDSWILEPGYYEIEMAEGCNMPPFAAMYFRSRSSMVRCGAEVISGQFDAGFSTDHIGCFLNVMRPIRIDYHARVAQAIVAESREVDKDSLYNGQFQHDKQR